MLFATAGQFPLFLWMVGAGVAVGALYSLCAGLRRLLSAGFWLTLAADAFFGLAAALTLIAALLLGCDGENALPAFDDYGRGALIADTALQYADEDAPQKDVRQLKQLVTVL